jgi:hypothetical protein
MTRNMPEKLRVRIFVAEGNNGLVWVPYKTLIGQAIIGRALIGHPWVQMHCSEEFETKTDAVEAAKRRAWIRLTDLFGPVDEIETVWEVIHERGPELVAFTVEDAPETIKAEEATAIASPFCPMWKVTGTVAMHGLTVYTPPRGTPSTPTHSSIL